MAAFAFFGMTFVLIGEPLWYLGAAYWTPVYFLAAAFGTVLCAFSGQRRWALAALVCVIAAGWLLAPWHLPLPDVSAADREPNLRILNANLWDSPRAATAFAALAVETQADIVLIQEADRAWASVVGCLEDDYPHHQQDQRIVGQKHYMGMLARIPVESHKTLKHLGVPGTETTFRVAGVPIRVINIHTNSPFSPRRIRNHRRQMDAITSYLRDAEGLIILAGDLNTVMWSPLYRRLESATGLVNARKGFGVLGTWPALPFPLAPLRAPIDHILVSPEIEVVHCRVGPGIRSDHRPLIADLYIPPAVFADQR